MGIFDKLKFWKKEEDFDFDKFSSDFDKDFSHENKFDTQSTMKDDPMFSQDTDKQSVQSSFSQEKFQTSQQPSQFQQQQSSPFSTPSQQPAFQQPKQTGMQNLEQMNLKRDLDLINSKLDTIKAVLVSLDQRVANIERLNQPNQRDKLW